MLQYFTIQWQIDFTIKLWQFIDLEFEPGTVRWKVKTNPLVFRYFEVQIITNKIIFKLQTIELATPRPSSPAPTANAFRSCGAATSTTTAATTPTSRPTSAETRTVLLDGEDVQVTLSPLAHHYSRVLTIEAIPIHYHIVRSFILCYVACSLVEVEVSIRPIW